MNPHLPSIPSHWSGEQALLVVDFLQELIAIIWQVHGDNMDATIEELHSSESQHSTAIIDDFSDLPF